VTVPDPAGFAARLRVGTPSVFCRVEEGAVLLDLRTVAPAEEPHLARTVVSDIPFWRMAAQTVAVLRERAEKIVAASGVGAVADTESVPGAGSAPGVTIPSCGVVLDGDHLAALRSQATPIVARVREGRTYLDLRSVDPGEDAVLIAALTDLAR
jgi:L-seryl-tRNA(Ser) seleniumtransferase